MYDVVEISKQLNISKATVYVKMKLPEVKEFIISQNGKTFVDEKGLEIIKQSLKCNPDTVIEIESLKNDIVENLKNNIEFLKDNIEFLKEQLVIKDNQIQDMKKLLENTQVLFSEDQEKNKIILAIPEVIKEHDIHLVNSLTQNLEKQRERYKIEIEIEKLQNKKRLLSKIFTNKKEYPIY